ncbi:MAG: alpha/beta fold hydrolase [Proteobacteria bacterium]|nr:MAG: alpha/beta fold hydrolase [Pseudomonadota bacterium]
MESYGVKQTETWFFLRGLVRESGHWSGFLEAFEARFPERRVVALDLPGNGTRYHEASPVSIEAMARALREAAAPFRGDKNYLFAISLGAMVGLEWMHQAPDDFAGAVLVNTSLRGLSPLHHRLRPANYPAILRAMRAKDFETRERIILALTSQDPNNVDRWAKPWAEIQSRHPVSVRNALRQLLAAIRFAPPKTKPRPPLLILNSAKDTLVDPLASQRLSAHWNAPLRVNPRSGHDLTLDDPEWVLEQLESFGAGIVRG